VCFKPGVKKGVIDGDDSVDPTCVFFYKDGQDGYFTSFASKLQHQPLETLCRNTYARH